jgi:S1-C subfamily serine protease
MLKNIKIIALGFVFGIAGGIFANQILWPYIIERPLFYKYRLDQQPVYVTEKNNVVIEENTALKDAIGRSEKYLVAIKTTLKSGKFMASSGVIVSSDGLVVALSEAIPSDGIFSFFIDGKEVEGQVLKRDAVNDLALIKIKGGNLTATGFADFGGLKIGERVFLIGDLLDKNVFSITANEGIVKSFNQENIKTNILEDKSLTGSPLFNIKGELLGLNVVDSSGNVSAIPISKIKPFLGF